VRESTPIVTTVHGVQIVRGRLPMLPHDLPIDFLITPDEVVATRPAHPRPRGVYWDLLRSVKVNGIPALRRRLHRGAASPGRL
jgi:5-formyltetrahydrofolate cyclo-ligase